MPKFENAPNLNNPELNPSELETGVNVEKKPETETAPEEQEKETEAKRQEIVRLTQSIEETKSKINEIRESMGLPPSEEDPPSVLSARERIDKLGGGIESSRQSGPFQPKPSKTEIGVSAGEGRRFKVEKLSPEDREKVEKSTFTFNGREYHTGDEVICQGKKWFVEQFEPTGRLRSKIEFVEDWDKDPYGGIMKEKVNPSSIFLVRAAGIYRDCIEVREGRDSVEPATPEAMAKLKKMKKEMGE